MNKLKDLNQQLATVRNGQAELAAKLGEIGAERHAIETASNDRAASIAAAEQALIDALAAAELGEQSDVEGARQRLNEASLQAQNGIEGATRLRVLDALRQRHEADHQALHEKGVGLIEQIKRAEIDALNDLANDLRNEAKAAMETTVRTESLLNAVRAELNERGANYTLPPLSELAIVAAATLTPNQARAEIARALAA